MAERHRCPLCSFGFHTMSDVVLADVMPSADLPNDAAKAAGQAHVMVAVHPWCKRDALTRYEERQSGPDRDGHAGPPR